MAIIVRNNMPALQTMNIANKNSAAFGKSLFRVSSGMRINHAADDTSGYSISERMQVMMRGLHQDTRNAQTGNSLLKVAQGAVSSTVEILKTLKEKAINAANDTNTDADRAMIQKELDQAVDQINDNANVTFNGKLLMDGSKSAKTEGTFTTLTNDSLAATTTGGSRLVDLADRRGNSLGIQVGDTVSVSYVQNGKTYSTSFAVTGSTSLATIMLKAENIDRSSQAFADITNKSVMAINGEVDISAHNAAVAEATRQRDAAQADYDAYMLKDPDHDRYGPYYTAVNNLETAKANLADYYTARENLRNAYNALTNPSSGFDALVSNYTKNVHPRAYDAYYEAYTRDYANWKSLGDNRTDYLHPYPPAITNTYPDLNSMLDHDRPNASRPETYDDALKLQQLLSSYQTSYIIFSAYGEDGERNLSQAITAAENNLAAAKREAARLNGVLDTKQAALDALIAPVILSGSEIGLDYYGNVQTTADLGSALTITAMNSGTEGQIAGFTVSVSGADGNVKKSVNAVLDDWNETIRAANAREKDESMILQTGTRPSQAVKVQLTDMRASALGLQGSDGTTVSVATQEKANVAINVIGNALKKAIEQQTTIGAMGSRLGYTSTNLQVASENVQASGSVIRDADMAKEMTEHTKNRVLLRSSQILLAQSNHQSYEVLSLLR